MSATGTPTLPRAQWAMGLQVAAVVLVIVGIQILLPDSVTVGPRWLIPALELLGLPLGLFAQASDRISPSRLRVYVTVYLVFLVLASMLNGGLLFLRLMTQSAGESGEALVLAGFGVLIINILSFALVYWWLDGGGPIGRVTGFGGHRDFLFPQHDFDKSWQPTLSDYLFTAYTNIIAFSPTDTMPLTHRVKFLFTLQSAVSLVTILVTLTRAINLLS